MSNVFAMNANMTAAARFAAAFGARSASMRKVILDAILVASIFVVLRLPVLVRVLVITVVLLVLVRIISGLVAPSANIRHKAKSLT